MSVPAVGDRVKVVERATTGETKVVTEGVVATVDEVNNRLDFEGFGRTKLTDTAGVNVRVEVLSPPLPTTAGSVVQVQIEGFDAPFIYFLTVGGWVDHTGAAASLVGLQRAPYELLYDAGAV